jgi:hypothetical protein
MRRSLLVALLALTTCISAQICAIKDCGEACDQMWFQVRATCTEPAPQLARTPRFIELPFPGAGGRTRLPIPMPAKHDCTLPGQSGRPCSSVSRADLPTRPVAALLFLHRWLGLQQRTCCEVVTWGNTPTEVAPTPPPASAFDENSLPDATGGGNSTSATALEDGPELSDAVVDREAAMTAELEAEFLRAAGRWSMPGYTRVSSCRVY